MYATYVEVAERGLGALTVEAVAVRAGASRATLYRHFPGGRDELVARTIDREVERFFVGVLRSAPDPGDRKSTRLNLQSLMRISYAVFCLKKKKNHTRVLHQ